ncbi:unnamed protein product [Toxocara canis]|uniref:Zinc finger protein n=1 Tax=Toxocara canis TaxID=6265 RepID=A0A183URB4_TOXCA|nr:unnamed protein product [Toxocara canis]
MSTTTIKSSSRLSRKRFRLDQLIDILGVTHESSMQVSSASIKQPLAKDVKEFKKTKMPPTSKRYWQRSLLSVEPLAIGGCRQCMRTFTDRIDFIHHMIDHFPAFFYSFEPLKVERHARTTSMSSPGASNISFDSSMVANTSSHSCTMKSDGSVRSSLSALNADLPYYMCPRCCSTFSEKGVYQSHMCIHEQSQPVLYSNCRSLLTMMSKKTHDGSRTMPECNRPKEVLTEETICDRQVQMHSPSNKACERCGKVFVSTFDLNLHNGTHNGFSYDCKDCGRCFDSRNALKRHHQTHRIAHMEHDGKASSEKKAEPKLSTSSFSGNTYIASLLSKYSNRKARRSPYKRPIGAKASERYVAQCVNSMLRSRIMNCCF